ncbi:MAG: STAS domain-containing protein [SAR324 cluster bacterium]|nr:STAS domain-containing protein [SAR324 cluster bacterium]
MELSHRIESEICIVYINGEVSPNTDELRTYLLPFLTDTQFKGLIINLEGVPFIGSTTVAIVLEAYQTIQNRRAHFALCQLNEINQKILSFTQINNIIDVFMTEKEAITEILSKGA